MAFDVKLDARPLVDLIERRGGIGAALRMRGADPGRMHGIVRAYHRAKRTGDITQRAADRLSIVVLGMHPCEVWGSEWYRNVYV